MTRCRTIDLDVPADSEIVVEGLIDCDVLEPEAPFGESNGYVALEAFNMPIEVTAITHKKKPVFAQIISQVTPSEVERHQEGGLRAAVPRASQDAARRQGHPPRGDARAADQSAAGDLPAVRRRHAAHRSLARLERRFDAAIELRQDRHRGERGHRSVEHGRGAVVARLPHQSGRRHAYRAQSRRRAGRAIRRQQDRLRAAGRCDAQARDAAARPADARIHGARARPVGGARPARAQRAGAVARLHARRLDRHLGDLRAPHHGRRLGGRPAARR